MQPPTDIPQPLNRSGTTATNPKRAPHPTRVVNLDAAREAHGPRADRLIAALHETDPLADAVVAAFSELPPGEGHRLLERALDDGIDAVPSAPRALIALFEALDRVPFWVDWEQLDRGGAAFLRCGFFGIAVLGTASLTMSYVAPAANKPLAFSRRLVEMAPRRLLDTMRFHLRTCLPRGLARTSDGFKISVRVRIVHAQMRRVLRASGRWDEAAWGAPLNQADSAYANVLFSAYPIEWLRRLGFRFAPDEVDAMMQLWRYSGYLLGVHPDLLCATEPEARRLGALYASTQAAPDDDSRALVRALMDATPALFETYLPETAFLADVWPALARHLVGDALIDGLGLPKTSYRHAIPLVRAAVARSPVALPRKISALSA